jgi:hypothetical protein
MKAQGFGGFFMHAREGLQTEYLSEDWFDRIAAAVKEAEAHDLEAWLYDEDRWPSGCAGGLVTAGNDDFKAKCLVMVPVAAADVERSLTDPTVEAVFRYVFDNQGNMAAAERIWESSQLQVPETGSGSNQVSYWQFQTQIQEPTANSNGHGYIDVFNPDAVEAFIRATHEKYREHVGKYLGAVVPGIFADEPTYRSKAEDSIPWSPLLPGYFQQDHGYDLTDHLPVLFFEYKNSARIRYDFFYTLTKWFVRCFTKRLYDWCEEHRLLYTGHYLSEDTMVKQTNAIGAAMPHYLYMHVPGIDHLGNNIDDSLTLKQCASVGNQFKRKRLLCENFGVSGHHMTFADQKWIANLHFALGITFMSQHLVLYSMTGGRKRDYPPTFSYHQPYWPYYRQINDYLARAGYFCSQGDYVCETLVLHPIGSVWATFAREKGKPLSSRYDAGLIKLQESLFQAQVPFDYGDELIMEEHAAVVDDHGKAFLQIGAARYSTVIVPPSLTWRQSTFELLQDFAARGGRLAFVGERPSMVGGEEAYDRWDALCKSKNAALHSNELSGLAGVLAELCHRPLEVRGDTDDILFQTRRDNNCLYLFITNTSRKASRQVTVTVPVDWDDNVHVYRCDFETGAVAEIGTRLVGNGWDFDLTLAPAEGQGYMISAAALDLDAGGAVDAAANALDSAKIVETAALKNEWSFARTHKNSLTLDYCRYRIGEAPWSGMLPVWQVRRRLWSYAGFNDYQEIQPWVILPQKDKLPSLPVWLQFEFSADDLSGELGVVAEQGHIWQLTVNGKPIGTETSGYYWDRQFGLIDIAKAVKPGKNIIELAGEFKYGVEIEEIYLVGDFALRQSGYQEYWLVQEPPLLTDGSWVYQGYPFYAGNMVYTQELDLPETVGRRFWIRLNQPKGTLFRVRLNDGEWKYLISQPWEVEVSNDCVAGKNLLQIEVVGSLRNTFGPLHHRLRSPAWCGPKQFEDESSWVGNYQFEDYGLMGGAELVITI